MKKGYLFCILSSLCLGTAPTMLAMMIQGGVSDASAPFYSSAFIFIAALVICLVKRTPMRVGAKMAGKLTLSGMLGMGATTTLLALSCNYIPAGTSIVIQFLYPTIITLVSIFMFKNKASKFTLPAIVCSIVGMLFISVIGNDSAAGGTLGYIFALGSAFTYSFYIITNERFGFEALSPMATLCYLNGAAALMMFVRVMLVDGKLLFPTTPELWGYALAYCTLTGLGFLFLNMGIACTSAVEASFATLVEPVVSVFSSAIFQKSPITLTMVFGFVLVFIALIMNSYYPPIPPAKTEAE